MRATWYSAAARLMSGSSPLAEAVTRSIGTGAVLPGSAARSAATRSFTASRSAGFDGPRLEPPDPAALFGPGDVAEGRLQKYFGSLKCWPIRSEPTVLPSRSIRLPAACCGKTARAMPVTASGIDDADQEREDGEQDESRTEERLHGEPQARWASESARSITLMPTNGTMRPPTP